MARTSMDVTSFVGKLLKQEDSEILRDGIQALAQMNYGGRGLVEDRCRLIRAPREPHHRLSCS